MSSYQPKECERRKLGIVMALLAMLLFSAFVKEQAHLFQGAADSAMPIDFPVYYVAGAMAHHRAQLYVLPNQDTALLPYFVLQDVNISSEFGQQARRLGFGPISPFIYPPFAALVMHPLTWFPPRLALFLWRCLTGLLTGVSVYFVLAMFGRPSSWSTLVFAVAGAFAFFPFVETAALGQANAVILACWAIGGYLAVRQKLSFSAFLFALGTLIKITPLFVLGVFVVRRQWKWVTAYLAWVIALGGVSVAVLGWAPHATYLNKVLPALSCGPPIAENKSLSGVIQSLALGDIVILGSGARFPLSSGACMLAKTLAASLYLGLLVFFSRFGRDAANLGSELAAIAMLSLLISPVSWRHHYLLALIPLIYLWLPEIPLRQWEIISLAAATLVIGTPFVDYAVYQLHGPVQIFLNALEVLAAFCVLGLMVSRIVDGRRLISSPDKANDLLRTSPKQATAMQM